MIIWYINHYAKPSPFGTSGRSFYLAKALKQLGYDVLVVSASHHHTRVRPAPPEDINMIRHYDNIQYLQLAARPYKGNGIGRVLNMFDFARGIRSMAFRVISGNLPTPDILIASSPHIFTYLPAETLAKKFGAKIIFEVRDIWPLSLIELAGLPYWHPLVLLMSHIEKQAYKRADAVVSLMPNALPHMEPRGLNPERFHYIPNGVDASEWDETGAPLPEEHQKVFDWCRQAGKLIVVYSGAHGVPNALEQILDINKVVNGMNLPYHFILIGSGAEKDRLIYRAKTEEITFVSFLPRIPKTNILSAIKQADVGFISLKDSPIFRFGISPNKLGDYLIAGIPVLYAIKAGNNPVKDSGAGIEVKPENPSELHEALMKFCEMKKEERKKMGSLGREYALKNLEWSMLGKSFTELCELLKAQIIKK